MNGFQSRGRGIKAHDNASTSGKKMANSREGKTTRGGAARYRTRWPFERLRRVRRLVLIGAVLLPLLAPAPAGAACGHAEHFKARKRLIHGRQPLAIGD